jgi:hypothetical protein
MQPSQKGLQIFGIGMTQRFSSNGLNGCKRILDAMPALAEQQILSFLGAATPLGAQPFQTEPELALNCYAGAVEIDANDGVLGELDDCGPAWL